MNKFTLLNELLLFINFIMDYIPIYQQKYKIPEKFYYEDSRELFIKPEVKSATEIQVCFFNLIQCISNHNKKANMVKTR